MTFGEPYHHALVVITKQIPRFKTHFRMSSYSSKIFFTLLVLTRQVLTHMHLTDFTLIENVCV